MKQSELKELIREEIQNVLNEIKMPSLSYYNPLKGHPRYDRKSRDKILNFVSNYFTTSPHPNDMDLIKKYGEYKTIQYYTDKIHNFWGWQTRHKTVEDMLDSIESDLEENSDNSMRLFWGHVGDISKRR